MIYVYVVCVCFLCPCVGLADIAVKEAAATDWGVIDKEDPPAPEVGILNNIYVFNLGFQRPILHLLALPPPPRN